MTEPPACNASPLIVLARAGHLDLLRTLYGSVISPELERDSLHLVGE